MSSGENIEKAGRDELMKRFGYSVAYSDGAADPVLGQNWMGTYVANEEDLMRYVGSLLKNRAVVGVSIRKLSDDQGPGSSRYTPASPSGKSRGARRALTRRNF